MGDRLEYQEDTACITVLTIGYKAKCTELGCGNLARVILRQGDRSGRPLSNLERCNRHARPWVRSLSVASALLSPKLGVALNPPRNPASAPSTAQPPTSPIAS